MTKPLQELLKEASAAAELSGKLTSEIGTLSVQLKPVPQELMDQWTEATDLAAQLGREAVARIAGGEQP